MNISASGAGDFGTGQVWTEALLCNVLQTQAVWARGKKIGFGDSQMCVSILSFPHSDG